MKYCLMVILVYTLNAGAQSNHYYLLKADRVFDGENMHTGWSVLVSGDTIKAVGLLDNVPPDAELIKLPGCTLLPGLIEGHSHLFLHPYNETSWNNQVLTESRAERTARAVNHARSTLLAGFTTVRDLGTEGAYYDDVGLKKAIGKGIIPGPRMLVATKALVVLGSYGPRPETPDLDWPQGAAEVSGMEDLAREVKLQISKGADIIKVYADYRWGINGEARATFSVEELALAVSIAKSSGRQVVAHATTEEGMRRAIEAGVSTIEHGDNGTAEVFRLMRERNVALCPTLAAGDATAQYNGWKKGTDPEPQKISTKRTTFQLALKAGVTICMGGDVGVFTHGDNAREMELMTNYGMKALDVLRASTGVNARIFGIANKVGSLRNGLLGDIIAVEGDPSANISAVRKVSFIMKSGKIILLPRK